MVVSHDLNCEYGAEVHLVREVFVSLGRILGLGMVFVMPQNNMGAVIVLVAMSVFELINSAILHRIGKNSIK